MSIPGLDDWLGSAQGRYVLEWEQSRVGEIVANTFGFNALQLGLPQIDFLDQNRMALRARIGEYGDTRLRCELTALPLATQSVDLIVLPHVLEFHRDPHQVLREIERVLIAEGQLLIVGFNPLSSWGIRCRMSRQRQFPWNGHYLSVLRLRDWLKLLGFEVDRGQFGCFAPPFSGRQWLSRSRVLESAGRRWWHFAGGVYVLRAIKRTPSMRLILPKWRYGKLRNKALRPVAQKENHGRQ